jgi:hypothetical protein
MNASALITVAVTFLAPALGAADETSAGGTPDKVMSVELRQALHERADAALQAALKRSELQVAQLVALQGRVTAQAVVPAPVPVAPAAAVSVSPIVQQGWMVEWLRCVQVATQVTLREPSAPAEGSAAQRTN